MRVIAALACIWSASAHATEVVWLDPAPSANTAAQIGQAAGAARDPLSAVELRAAATAWSQADDDAYTALDEALRDVRMYETRLDGELLIMRGLQVPVDAITVVRDQADRDKLFAALAYQGFAVDRFFQDELATDDRAEPYRIGVDGRTVERPWFDAVAIDPSREVTAYEIAEAPQRVAFGRVRDAAMSALPATISVDGLPQGSQVVIDGRDAATEATGGYRVPPGRHLVHARLEGAVIERWDVRLGPAGETALQPELSTDDWTSFVGGLRRGATPTVPAGLAPMIDALGGAVWLATVDARGRVSLYEATPEAVTAIPTPKMGESDTGAKGFSGFAGLSAGWFYSADFYLQDPTVPRTKGTVNALALSVDVGAAFDVSMFRAVAGVDLGITLGEFHTALYNDSGSTRLRPYLYVGAGVTWAQVTLGYRFPYHPSAGLRIAIPIVKGIEVQGTAYYGLGLPAEREDDSAYDFGPLGGANLGIAYRL